MFSQNKDIYSEYIKNKIPDWLSGNKKVDDFILERLSNINSHDDVVFEWIPYNQFNKIKETGKNGSITVYSAIWRNGPLHKKYKWSSNYTRDSNKEVALKCLHNLQNPAAIWKNGPLHKKYKWGPPFLLSFFACFLPPSLLSFFALFLLSVLLLSFFSDYTRDSNKEVALHNLQNPVDFLIDEAKKYSTKNDKFLILYGISQNPDTNDYILVQNYLILSRNENIDNFIQERQLNINSYDDVVFDWIPYNQFNEIKETDKNGSITVYSAIWRNGPLHKKDECSSYYTRDSNKEVALKCLHNLQNPVDFLIDEAKKYSTKNDKLLILYGISQNPDTNDYILVQNYLILSRDENIDNFIQERQLNINSYDDVVFEWIPYNQFNEIKETGKNGSITVYSAIWRNGPLHKKDECSSYYTRDSNKEVALKCLHNLQNSVDFLIDEAKKYSTKNNKFLILYGISQNPDTNDYILVQNYLILSRNENIDNFIQERQLNINFYDDVVFEWIPYNQFNEIKETGKNGSITVYSAILWRNGSLHKKDEWSSYYTRDSNKEVALKCLHNLQNPVDFLIDEAKKYSIKNSKFLIFNMDECPLHKKDEWSSYYTRDSNKEVALKCLHNLQNFVDSLINEAKKYSTKNYNFHILYGVSQNPYTSDYILVQNNSINLVNWMIGNKKIDDFIQERQLDINFYNDVVFEWIPYNQFNEIKETGKNGSVTVYSAEWSNGPLHYKKNRWGSNYTRDSNKKVTLKCLHNLQNPVDSLISEAKKYSAKNDKFFVFYGISQNPYTNNYILVQKYLTWTSGNVKIDNFIHARRDKISSFPDAIFEWIPYNQFNEIKEIGKGGFSTVYSAIWKDFKVALKCLDNSQHPANELLNEVEAYSTKMALSNSKIMNIYGISQDPNTKNYIVVLHYAEGGSFNNWLNINENYKYFNWKDKMQILRYIASGLRELHRKQICWDLNPENRPNINELDHSLSLIANNKLEIEKAEEYRKLHLSSLKGDRQITTHPQAIYTSRLLNPFTENLPKYNDDNSECLDCAITNNLN
ncbi:uncharacterized protein OCT59_008621 [Rhizophagus irregularis]|uniref:uncharacterized protein n=1 Tax=Rhizophagus irregularis TaxID=588596 RepID=UPI00332A2491|nr:hypothetical protein OCT59_008621 [Rhizophagus irregularis]